MCGRILGILEFSERLPTWHVVYSLLEADLSLKTALFCFLFFAFGSFDRQFIPRPAIMDQHNRFT